MKKLVSMLLLAAMLLSVLTGCGSSLKDDEKGATINLYIANEVRNFDPALAYTDDSTVKLMGLIYEGLTRINADGKVENALMKKYKIIENEEKNDYRMEITIKDTKWSDGRVVSADDVIYAWKRILDAEFTCAAAPLLFDIKNAYEIKNGDMSIDDLGVAASDDKVIEIRFTGKIDYNRFLENLASPALVPLREDIVTRFENFGTAVSTMCANGPFAVKGLEAGKSVMLERNSYYYRNTEKGDALDKYVTPYRLVINYEKTEEENTVDFENGSIFYLGEIGLSKRADYAKSAKVRDLLSTHMLQFNTSDKLLSDKSVRKALSLALDRNAIADLVVFAEPATGIIPGTVYDKKVGDSFRKNGGDLISASADTAAAQALLGSGSKRFSLTHKKTAVDTAIAEYCKAAWEAIGFTVKLVGLNTKDYNEAYETGDYDVISLDYQCLSTDAFGALAVFAPTFSGCGIDIQNDNYDSVPFVKGYNNEEINALVMQAYQTNDRSERSAILHQIEEKLIEDMPVVPLIFNQDAYVVNSKVLSGIKDNYFGYRTFNKLTMKNWRSYVATAE